MPDKITLREIYTKTYPWASYIGIDNHTKALQAVIDELDQATDEVIRARYADRHITMDAALQDPRIAEDAQIVYAAIRRITLVLLQDHADEVRAQEQPETPEEEDSHVK